MSHDHKNGNLFQRESFKTASTSKFLTKLFRVKNIDVSLATQFFAPVRVFLTSVPLPSCGFSRHLYDGEEFDDGAIRGAATEHARR